MDCVRNTSRRWYSLSVICIILAFYSEAAAMGTGLRIGLSHSNFYGEDAGGVGLDSKFGLSAGIFMIFPLNEFLSIRPEILYNQKGAKEDYSGYDMGGITNVVILDYLEIPMHLKFTMPGKLNFTPSLFLGPSFSMKIRGLTKEKYGGHSQEDDLEDIRGYDAGIDFGLCIDIRLGKRILDIDVRYNYGLFPIFKEVDDWTPKIKNKTLFFTIGYTL